MRTRRLAVPLLVLAASLCVFAAQSAFVRFIRKPENMANSIEKRATVQLAAEIGGQYEWSPDGLMIGVPTVDGTISLVSGDTGMIARQLDHGTRATSVAWSPDGVHICAASIGSFRVWRVADGTLAVEVSNPDIYDVQGWSDAECVVTYNGEELFTSWSIVDGSLKGSQFVSIAQQQQRTSPDMRHAAWQSRAEGRWTVFSVEKGVGTEWELQGYEGIVHDVAWAPSSSELAGACENGVVLWRASDGALITQLGPVEMSMKSVSWSSDGELILATTSDNTVIVVSAGSREELGRTEGDPRAGARWSPRVQQFAVVASSHPTQFAIFGRGSGKMH